MKKFTLMELLIVVAIIGILLSLLALLGFEWVDIIDRI